MKPTEPTPGPGDAQVTAAGPESLPGDRKDGYPIAHFTVSDHELLRRIGSGAYGEVWLARNVLGELRAVKVIHRSRFSDERPFEREFEGIQRFEPISRSHPSQLAILHVGKNDAAGFFYYVMELADGEEMQNEKCKIQNEAAANPTASSRQQSILNFEFYILNYRPKTLRSLLQPNPQPSTPNSQPTTARLPISDCVQIGLSLTTALAHLHQHGLVHRDIKPSNVIFVNGVPKLGDIGLVTEAGDTQSIVGTEGYLPPEGPGTTQADIFSLGKVLYEISTGMDRRRFAELPEDLRAWPDRNSVVEFNEIVLKACAKDPDRRYQSAGELRADLALLQRGKSVKRKRVLHHWLSVGKKAGLAVLLVSMVVAAAVVLRQHPFDSYHHSAIPGVDKLVEQGDSIVEGRSAERLRTALEKYGEAIQLDPKFVPAQFGVFTALMYRGGAERGATDEDRRELRAVAKKLMEMDANLAEARAASSMIKWVDWQFPEALAEAHLATQTRAASKQGKVAAHAYYGWFLMESGKPDDALAQYRLAEEKSPSGPVIQHHLGHPYFVKRDFEQALKHYRESLKLEGRQGIAHYLIGRVYVEQTNFIAAIQEFEEGEKMNGKYNSERKVFYDSLREAVQQSGAEGYWTKRLNIALGKSEPDLYYIATLYARLGNKNKAYRYLRDACKKKSFDQGLMFDLCWDHDDPEFKAIARSIRLIQ